MWDHSPARDLLCQKVNAVFALFAKEVIVSRQKEIFGTWNVKGRFPCTTLKNENHL
jgi:hypothetical protein